MDNILLRYLNKIGLDESYRGEFETAFFDNIKVANAGLDFQADFHVEKFLSYKCIKEFLSCLDAFEKEENGFHSTLAFKYSKEPDEETIKNFINDFIEDTNFYDLANFRVNMKDHEIVFEYSSLNDSDSLKEKTSDLGKILKRVSYPFSIQMGMVVTSDESGMNAKIEDQYQNEAKKQAEIYAFDQVQYEKQKVLDATYIPCKIKDAASGTMKRVEVTGTIFSLEMKDIKNHTKHLLTIYYSDNSYSIISSVFEGKKFDYAFLNSFKEGDRIQVRGMPEFDNYSKQMAIRVNDIQKLPPLPKRMDTYEGQKRIELHLHTKMSAMDGVAEAKDYVSTVTRWGWDAIGVTDHGCVNAFPDFQDATRKSSLKVLYGCELYMVDSKLKIAFNPSPTMLKDATYVVLDLETSGLSARYDRIIEFGACKYKNGTTVDSVDFFVNPDIPLSKVTTDLTGITDEDVRGGKPIKVALRDIVEFCKGSVLVTHNALFDYGFINEALRKNNMPLLDNPVIDTLPLSRYMYPEISKHTLGAVCRRVKTDYDEDSAHRAIYDAEVLLNVWQAMESTLLNTNPHIKHEDLNSFTSKEVILNAPHPYHVCVYVKNSQGLKDLFRIISDSNIKYFKDVPRVPRELLEQYRSNFIIGSACFNGEVFESAMTKSEDYTKNIMKFYDYIEVQPPSNYSWLVNEGKLSSNDDVLKIIKDVIKMAKDLNKPVVATSDCHYIDNEDKIYRDVFVFAKGLKGARHPLNSYHRSKAPYYENPDQHLRTTDEMLKEFAFLKDDALIKEIVITNTHLIADQISGDVRPIHDHLSAPTIDNCDILLKNKVYKKAHEWYGDPLPEIIQERLDAEMKGISENHYEVIYWIASKIVSQATEDGYIVGSRGSVGSSFVATMASITEVNPLMPHYRCPKCKHTEFITDGSVKSGFDLPEKTCPICGEKMIHDGQNIPFATFIGFHAEKTPDIDLNFPPDYQPHAHELTKTLLTKESGNHVYKAGTLETVADKNAIGYAKGYFEELGNHPELHVEADKISNAELLRISKGCIGVKRTTGQHPGGIIVVPRGMDVYDYTPIQYPADKADANWETSQFDYNQMHDTILKLDLLGHVDPQALRMMSLISGKNIYEIPFNDKDVMSLFSSPDALHMKHNYLDVKVGTMGMPEFGTQFVMNLLNETHPKNFADLLIVSGLSHGTNVYAGNQQDLIKSNVTDLRGVIGCRDDIMLGLHDKYGIPLEDSFKIMELVRHNRFTLPKFAADHEKYCKEMREHGVPEYYISSCDKIQYLFPKGHAVAYCMMGVRVGWFKVHDPLAFYATYFTTRCNQFDLKVMAGGDQAVLNKLRELDEISKERKLKAPEEDLKQSLMMTLEMYDRGYGCAPLNINKSDSTHFTMDREHNCIIPPFNAIGGLGEAAANSVVEARKDGPFTSIEELSSRTKLSSQHIQGMKDLGALKGIPESNQISLFDFMDDEDSK